MPAFLLPLALGGASFLGGLFGNRKQTSTSRSTSTTTPTLDPQFSPLQQMLLSSVQSRLANPSSLPASYETQGIADINRNFDLVAQARDNSLAARGLSASPVAGAADAKAGVARAGEIGRFQAQIPLLNREMQTQDLGIASLLLNQGRGSTTSTTSTGTQPGNMLGGGLNNLAGMLGFLYGQGMFGGGGASPGLRPLI